MKYYKVKNDCSLKGQSLVKDELLTKKELDRKGIPHSAKCFEEVELSSRYTHMLFGCRFKDRRD